MPKQQYCRAKLTKRFSTMGPNKGELLFGYWYLFLPKKMLWSKNQIQENRFLGQIFFPDFGAQIIQQHFFIIWQGGQTPHQSFFTNIRPNGPTGNPSIFGSQIKKNSLLALCQNGNIVVQNLQHVFRQLGRIRVSYYFDISNFFLPKTNHSPKTKFGKIVFWA